MRKLRLFFVCKQVVLSSEIGQFAGFAGTSYKVCDLVITNVSLPTLRVAFICSVKLSYGHYEINTIGSDLKV